MKKWLLLSIVAILALSAYVVSGPYRTVRAIRHAIQAQDAAALADEVDFPALRASLKIQLGDRLVRKAGPKVQANLFGAFGIRLAQGLTDAAVETMVTPLGLGALIEGRKEWAYLRGVSADGDDTADGIPSAQARDPLRDVDYRYQSPSRVTATVHDAHGNATVLVLTRTGMQWRLSDIRLPQDAGTGPG
jgi:Protein of unknown function (DUF2939)